jgi:hypothetical protein
MGRAEYYRLLAFAGIRRGQSSKSRRIIRESIRHAGSEIARSFFLASAHNPQTRLDIHVRYECRN